PDSLFTGYRQPLYLLLQSNGYPVDFVGSETAGYAAYPKYDFNNAGFGGYTKKQILNLIETGFDAHGNVVTPGPYLNYYPANIILLHIGTNQVDTSTADVVNLLNYIDQFEDSTNSLVWVILAKIINRVPYSQTTAVYNENLQRMADNRIQNGDHIKLIDMENDAGLVYKIDTVAPYNNGDMQNYLHPNNRGYAKMASLFYDTLSVLLNDIIPVELTNFSYAVSNDSVTLRWQTALELNNYGFVIERSSDGNIWENVGFVTGADNSYSFKQYEFTDTPSESSSYLYRLRQIGNNGNSKYIAQVDIRINPVASALKLNNDIPKEFRLEQNYPNPFNPTTVIKYSVPTTSKVDLKIYNTLGQLITTLVNNIEYPGTYEKVWDGSRYASGVYYYILNLSADNGSKLLHFTKKMILVK
ncbi:MAG: T9SS type A sorting domain-containing protein, partial [Ignavibacteriaceae bacterium]